MWSSTQVRLAGLPALVTLADLKSADLDPDIARRACAAGTWSEVLPRAWLRDPGPVTQRHRERAALLLAGKDAMLTGAAACEVLGLRDVPPDARISVLVAADVRRSLGPAVRLIRSRLPVEGSTVNGLRIAAPGRAVVDAARQAQSVRDARALVTAAVADGWCGLDELAEVLAAGPRRGSAMCRRALDAAAAGCRSAPEAEVAEAVGAAVRTGRLPPYVLNAEVFVRGVRLGAPDGWLKGLGLGWEVDSERHHGDTDGLDATLQRHDRFVAAGVALLHVTPKRFRRAPGAFVDELCARAAERRRLAVAEPPGLTVVERPTR